MEIHAQRAYKIKKFLKSALKNRLIDRGIEQKLYLSSRTGHKII